MTPNKARHVLKSPPKLEGLRVVGEMESEGRHFLIVEADTCSAKPPARPNATSLRTAAPRGASWTARDFGARLVAVEPAFRTAEIMSSEQPKSHPDMARVLTERELQIAALVATGQLNKQIAIRLRISEYTVCTHIRRIYSKLGIKCRSSLASLYTLSRTAHDAVDETNNPPQ